MMSQRRIVLADAPERVTNRLAHAAAGSLGMVGSFAITPPEPHGCRQVKPS
jgi:hypothetical protein